MLGQKRKGTQLMNLIIFGLVGAVLLGALLGTIADNTIGIQNTGNITGATSTLVGLVPIALLIGVVVAFFAMAGIKVATSGG